MNQGTVIVGAILASFVIFITARTDPKTGNPELTTYLRLLF